MSIYNRKYGDLSIQIVKKNIKILSSTKVNKEMGLDNGFTGLNNSRQASVALERINDVSAHMLSQYSDFKNSSENANELFSNIYDNMRSVSDYFKQTFAARGVSVDNIRCEKMRQHSLF